MTNEIPKIIKKPPGPKSASVYEKCARLASPSGSKLAKMFQIAFEEGRGVVLKDLDGNSFLDFSSGVIVTNTGHCHPKVVDAIKKQAEKLLFCYDHAHPAKYNLLEGLNKITPGKRKKIILLNTGAEAIEASIRLAKAYTKKYEFITFFGSFHGRSLGASSLTSSSKANKGFGPLMPGVLRVPYPYCYRCPFKLEYPACNLYCMRCLDDIMYFGSTDNIAGLFVEAIQGPGGCLVPPDDFLPALKKFCDKHHILLIVDEIQTSFGRTGKMFAVEHWNVVPDLLCVGKGIASGLPISAVIAREDIMNTELWARPYAYSTTFGGNPISCAAASATIKVLKTEKLVENAAKIGEYMLKRLNEIKEDHKLMGNVTGKGLLIGIDLVKNNKTKEPATMETMKVVEEAYKNGLLLLTAGWWDNFIKITPPLTINEEQAEIGINILNDALKRVEGKNE